MDWGGGIRLTLGGGTKVRVYDLDVISILKSCKSRNQIERYKSSNSFVKR